METVNEGTIGGRLRILRENAGITQKELAEALKIYYPTVISMYESEKRVLPIDVLVRYSKIFNVSTDWILKGEERSCLDELDNVVDKIRHSKVKNVALCQLKALLSLV